jgi:hypothetical protein
VGMWSLAIDQPDPITDEEICEGIPVRASLDPVGPVRPHPSESIRARWAGMAVTADRSADRAPIEPKRNVSEVGGCWRSS